MRLYTVRTGGAEVVAAEGSDKKLYPLKNKVRGMNELITSGSKPDDIILESAALPEGSYQVIAPVPVPMQDVVCIARNYYAPGEERGKSFEEAVYFSKRVSWANFHGGVIPEYDIAHTLDYETELGVILSRDVKGASVSEADNSIFGYTIINDLSDRELQKSHKQWYFSKSMDGYTSMGPCIVTADEFGSPDNKQIRTYVNGELRQDGNTCDMIRSAVEMISELSQYITLRAGTVIATGTPFGSGKDMSPPVYLRSGDTVVGIIEGIGELRNIVGKC